MRTNKQTHSYLHFYKNIKLFRKGPNQKSSIVFHSLSIHKVLDAFCAKLKTKNDKIVEWLRFQEFYAAQ